MKAVKLLKPYKHYNEGEVAGFGEEVNQKLIDAKIAEPYAEADAKPAKQTAKSPAGQ